MKSRRKIIHRDLTPLKATLIILPLSLVSHPIRRLRAARRRVVLKKPSNRLSAGGNPHSLLPTTMATI
jgi:hypothetical protein